jgi:hypothetical protein
LQGLAPRRETIRSIGTLLCHSLARTYRLDRFGAFGTSLTHQLQELEDLKAFAAESDAEEGNDPNHWHIATPVVHITVQTELK